MKKILALLLTTLSFSAYSQHWHHYSHGHGGGNGWVAPVIIGGVIGYTLSRQNQQQPVVVYQNPPVIVEEQRMYCTEWKEVMKQDGTITKERTCYQR